MTKPLCIDLFSGLAGWSQGFLSEGWQVIAFDIEDMFANFGMEKPKGDYQLVLQDVLTLNGAQFKNADLIVASPPCTEYSYMAMPFSRGKQIEKALLGEGEFPEGYKGSRNIEQLNQLFNACFRIQNEASKTAGRRIPLIVENVRGAQKWVGRSRWNYGSYHLWGDVPALMPMSRSFKNPGFRFDGSGKSFQTESVKNSGFKKCGQNWSRFNETGEVSPHWNQSGTKQGGDWFGDCSEGSLRNYSSDSDKRKRASAMIAKIPFPLSQHIARVFYPRRLKALG